MFIDLSHVSFIVATCVIIFLQVCNAKIACATWPQTVGVTCDTHITAAQRKGFRGFLMLLGKCTSVLYNLGKEM